MSTTKGNKPTANKKVSEYDKHLTEAKNRAHKNAKDDITKLYNDLRQEGLDPEFAAERIRTDLADTYASSTIRQYLPQEAKRKYEKKQIAMSSDIDPKKQIEVSTTGHEEPITTPPELPKYNTSYRPLYEQKKNTLKKYRVDLELDAGQQMIPLAVFVYAECDCGNCKVNVMGDRVEIARD